MTNLPRRILIIDDDDDFLTGMRMQFRGTYGVLTARSIAQGLELLHTHDVDLVLLDVGLEGEDGLEGIKRIRSVHPSVGVAMLSGRRDVKTVVTAIREGAVDYLTKPVDSDTIAQVIERAIATRAVHERCEALLSSAANGKSQGVNVVHKSSVMRDLLQEVQKIKGHIANVLIVGETGTGKEILARHINEQEGDKKRPFIAVNCAAIPENLLESELFGHEAGAFTGANRRRIGKFELADNGDIFLDEISAMKLDLQVKLLRVLQEREFCRLGSNSAIHANFRVISASNQPLDHLVETGLFRSDLYHRLNVIQFTVPPLRDRKEDIPLLVDHFIKKLTGKDTKKRTTDRAMTRLLEYSWPGNVRELANVVHSLVIMTKGDVIDEDSFPTWVLKNHRFINGNGASCNGNHVNGNGATAATLKELVQQAERQHIEQMLKQNDGDKTKAAAALGIGRTTLYMKMRELGIEI